MSPIKDLSDAIRLPRLGHIRLGKKHPEKGYPMKTDYFVFDKDHPVTEKAHEVFGAEPKTLRIYIPSEEDEVWCSQYYQSYDQTHGLVCRGDGEKALMMVDTATGEMANPKSAMVTLRDVSCQGKACPNYTAKKCHERMSLRFLIPELPGLGVWQIDTGSINSILNINSSAKLIRSAFNRISLIPLELTLEPAQVNNPESGKKQTVFVLNLRTSVTIVQLAERAREETRKLLVAPLDDYDPADMWDNGEEKKPTTADEDCDKLGHDKAPAESTTTPTEQPPAPAAIATKETTGKDEQPAPEKVEGVDMDWLRESLNKLSWTTVGKWIKDHYPEAHGAKVSELVKSLTVEHRKAFAGEVEDRLKMA